MWCLKNHTKKLYSNAQVITAPNIFVKTHLNPKALVIAECMHSYIIAQRPTTVSTLQYSTGLHAVERTTSTAA
jgi:hypothetical protein